MPPGRSQPGAIKGTMPCKGTRESLESEPADSIEEALVRLKLSAKDPDKTQRIDYVLHVLRDVVSGPSIFCEDNEALWWEIFAEVFASEVAAQTCASAGREPSSSCKRQILADILVWAEVTQDHYDSCTQRFVTEPHKADESFQRIGRIFRSVKACKGLGSPAVDACRAVLDAERSLDGDYVADGLNLSSQPSGKDRSG